MIEELSSWTPEDTHPAYAPLQGDLQTDVVIIGGGITGILSAYLLAREGKKVALIEKERLGSGATGATTAFVTQAIDTGARQLIEIFGREKAGLVWQSGGEAISLIEKIAQTESIECGFRRTPAHIYASGPEGVGELQDETNAIKELGFAADFSTGSLPFPNHGAIKIDNQALFDPMRFIQGVAKAAETHGAQIFESTEALDIESGTPARIVTPGGTITADHVIIATYAPFTNPIEFVAKKGLYCSYVFEVKIPQGMFEPAQYWDDENPYHYFRIDPMEGYDRMIVGGEDHRHEIKMDAEKNFASLQEYLRGIMGSARFEITRRWVGPILEPLDGLPTIGRIKDNQYACTGFSGNGMTFSAVSAMLFRDLILGRHNAWETVYDPTRVPSLKQLASKGRDYVEELAGGAIKNATGK